MCRTIEEEKAYWPMIKSDKFWCLHMIVIFRVWNWFSCFVKCHMYKAHLCQRPHWILLRQVPSQRCTGVVETHWLPRPHPWHHWLLSWCRHSQTCRRQRRCWWQHLLQRCVITISGLFQCNCGERILRLSSNISKPDQNINFPFHTSLDTASIPCLVKKCWLGLYLKVPLCLWNPFLYLGLFLVKVLCLRIKS